MDLHPRARTLIEELGLEPHIEGGYYRELFRSASRVRSGSEGETRSALTTIYFLLTAGVVSRWHRVTADEVWHFYEGDPIELVVAPPELETIRRVELGAALVSDGPVFTVPAGWWQAARPAGAYALAGCTVGPGFEFDDFSFLRDDAEALARLQGLGADVAALV